MVHGRWSTVCRSVLISLKSAASPQLVERHGERFTGRVFTPGEVADCGGRAESLAARWAAKEAVAKALGTGIGEMGWQEIEVLRGKSGCPIRAASRPCGGLAVERGLTLLGAQPDARRRDGAGDRGGDWRM